MRKLFITPYSYSNETTQDKVYLYMFDYFELNYTLSFRGKYEISNP